MNTQNPFALIFGGADSRLAAEIIFDVGLGDVFVVRTAGHVIDDAVLGSLEYAISVLHVARMKPSAARTVRAILAASRGQALIWDDAMGIPVAAQG